MSDTERTVIVADLDLPADVAAAPNGIGLVRAARDAGADRVAIDVRATCDGWAVVCRPRRVRLPDGREDNVDDLELADVRDIRCAKGTISTLEETMLEAHREGLGLVIRIHDTYPVRALEAALGIMGRDDPATLRARYLVVVPDARVGKRLRADAGKLPSALHLSAGTRGWREPLRRRFANLARAAADADDLMIDADLAAPEVVAERLIPTLRRRGAFVWVSGLDAARRADYENIGAGGLVLRSRPTR